MDIAGLRITPIGDDCVLLEPNEGLDPCDPDTYLLPLLTDLQKNNAHYLIYDMKKVAIVNSAYLNWLSIMSRMLGISGIQMIVVSLRPHTVFALSRHLTGKPPFLCALDVDSARQRARDAAQELDEDNPE